jgi:DNA-binding CsgD family transcriptional regulator
MSAPPNPAFRGRSRERQVLDALLDGVRRGEGGALVMHGEPGIGKTALLGYLARQASGIRVARLTGVESEIGLPFAALHQLCSPMLDLLPALREPQSQALRTALGMTAGTPPDRFVVGLAVLNLLCESAARRPLAVLVDDVQWLDAPTAQLLGFVGRRLVADPVLLVLAIRETADRRDFTGLTALSVGGLSTEDARSLLAAAVPGHLDHLVRDRIIGETRGNPLALLELPKQMSPSELAGGFALPDAGTLHGRLHEGYVRRIHALPGSSQTLLLLAATDPTGDALLVWRAAQVLDIAREAADAEDFSNLLEIGSRVQFRHPLVRSAAYAAATDEERGTAHRALAQATDAESDAERRVWHQAASTTDPDETIAAQLERTAGSVQARAGLAAAAVFLERSFALSPDSERRTGRGLDAADAYLQAGAFDRALSLIAQAAAGNLTALQRARVEQLRGLVEAATKPGSEAPRRLVQAAQRLESLDTGLARETYLRAWWAAFLAGQHAKPGSTVLDVSLAALGSPRAGHDHPRDLLLDGLASLVAEGRLRAAPKLRAVVDLYLEEKVSAADWVLWGRSITTAALALWDFDSYSELSDRQVARVRDTGALSQLVISLNFHANVSVLRGDLETARRLVAEQYAVKEVTGIRMATYGGRLLAAYRGKLGELEAIDAEPLEPGDGYADEAAHLGYALLHVGWGRYGDALRAAEALLDSATLLDTWGLPLLIEAAARSGKPDLAHEALVALRRLLMPGSDWADGVEARCRALVSGGEEADLAYQDAIASLGRTDLKLETARAHLLYGEWLRQEGRQAQAREHLNLAHEVFTAVGADGFADRAHAELVAAGAKMTSRGAREDHELTPQEEHIARLARDGHTNPEIGAELFISPRTVEWHLRKVFIKLGISSRGELTDALPAPSS